MNLQNKNIEYLGNGLSITCPDKSKAGIWRPPYYNIYPQYIAIDLVMYKI